MDVWIIITILTILLVAGLFFGLTTGLIRIAGPSTVIGGFAILEHARRKMKKEQKGGKVKGEIRRDFLSQMIFIIMVVAAVFAVLAIVSGNIQIDMPKWMESMLMALRA